MSPPLSLEREGIDEAEATEETEVTETTDEVDAGEDRFRSNLSFLGGGESARRSFGEDLFSGVEHFSTGSESESSCSSSSIESKAEAGLISRRPEKSSSISRPSSIKRKSSGRTSENLSSVAFSCVNSVSSHSSVLSEMFASCRAIVAAMMFVARDQI